MLRKPLGEFPVGVCQFDTAEIGESCPRKVPLLFYYPSAPWTDEYPYKEPGYLAKAPESPDNGVHTFCGDKPALSDAKKTFPVVLFSHGLCGYSMENTTLCADLASHGYVVISIGHPFGSKIVSYTDGTVFSDPEPFRTLRRKVDMLEALWYEDTLAAFQMAEALGRDDDVWGGRLDLSSAGIVGDSFGGCCAIAAALKNGEIRYAVNLDGGLFVPFDYVYLQKPILVLCRSWNIKAYPGLSSHGCTQVEIVKYRGMKHYEFSDGVYLGPKGKKNRSWADQNSRERSERILQFLRKTKK